MIAAHDVLTLYTSAGRVLAEGGTHALTSLLTLFGLWMSAGERWRTADAN